MNGARLAAPASNEKLYTTAALLETLGPSYQLHTRVFTTGTVTDGTLAGDLYLVGGGDPSLSSPGFAARNLDGVGSSLAALAQQVADAGITHVTGHVYVDESMLDDQRYVRTWPTRFRYVECAALGALTVDHNATRRTWSSRTASRMPAQHAGMVFRRLLLSSHVQVSAGILTGRTPQDATQIADLPSPPLWKLLQFMDRESDNFTAETLIKDLGAIDGGAGTTARGVLRLRMQLTAHGFDVSALTTHDGSGLSPSDRTTSRSIAGLLATLDRDATLGPIFRVLLPVSGYPGTLQHRLAHSPFRGHVFAKTGTLDVASALSGFAVRGTSHRFGFSIMMWTPHGRVPLTKAHALQDRIAAILVN
jgi:D-alanyl-D-alanine carboxypeptidase/D-alanyl-D-alanine-endopeptidase (penicillin-binding protein 4)